MLTCAAARLGLRNMALSETSHTQASPSRTDEKRPERHAQRQKLGSWGPEVSAGNRTARPGQEGSHWGRWNYLHLVYDDGRSTRYRD